MSRMGKQLQRGHGAPAPPPLFDTSHRTDTIHFQQARLGRIRRPGGRRRRGRRGRGLRTGPAFPALPIGGGGLRRHRSVSRFPRASVEMPQLRVEVDRKRRLQPLSQRFGKGRTRAARAHGYSNAAGRDLAYVREIGARRIVRHVDQRARRSRVRFATRALMAGSSVAANTRAAPSSNSGRYSASRSRTLPERASSRTPARPGDPPAAAWLRPSSVRGPFSRQPFRRPTTTHLSRLRSRAIG